MRIKILGLVLFTLLNASPAAYAQLPNIVIILVDDMGYGDAGCYNAESKIPTPNIDSLAAQGLRFTDAHAPGPLCHLSRYGLMTGVYPFRADTNQWRKALRLKRDKQPSPLCSTNRDTKLRWWASGILGSTSKAMTNQ